MKILWTKQQERDFQALGRGEFSESLTTSNQSADDNASRYVIRHECNQVVDGEECRGFLNDTTPMTAKEVKERWIRLVLTAGFNSGACPKCKYRSFSDLNIGGSLHIYDGDTEVAFEGITEPKEASDE